MAIDPTTFDPAAPADPGSGLFGLDCAPEESLVHVLPVPYEATVSYRRGTAKAPGAILRASHQLDFFDLDTGRPYRHGIYLHPESKLIRKLDARARRAVDKVHGASRRLPPPKRWGKALESLLATVNGCSQELNSIVRQEVAAALEKDRIVGLLGGDHSTPFGSIEAHAEKYPGLGILVIDAHHDLREAYEGFEHSHASIFHNVHERIPAVSRIVQVGVRDLAETEFEACRRSRGKIACHYDRDLAEKRMEGVSFATLAERIVGDLPEKVYVSFDVDGLSPHLCPGTGTPVPGGLSFDEAVHLLKGVVRSGRTIVGFDLVEVGTSDLDASVGARILYKLIGVTLGSRGLESPPRSGRKRGSRPSRGRSRRPSRPRRRAPSPGDDRQDSPPSR
jgi:agmatinase